jgi:hypothetical protein
MTVAGAPPSPSGTPWYVRCGIIDSSDELNIHEVDPETFAEVHAHDDGTATLDEGWGGAWIETDTLIGLEDCR